MSSLTYKKDTIILIDSQKYTIDILLEVDDGCFERLYERFQQKNLSNITIYGNYTYMHIFEMVRLERRINKLDQRLTTHVGEK